MSKPPVGYPSLFASSLPSYFGLLPIVILGACWLWTRLNRVCRQRRANRWMARAAWQFARGDDLAAVRRNTRRHLRRVENHASAQTNKPASRDPPQNLYHPQLASSRQIDPHRTPARSTVASPRKKAGHAPGARKWFQARMKNPIKAGTAVRLMSSSRSWITLSSEPLSAKIETGCMPDSLIRPGPTRSAFFSRCSLVPIWYQLFMPRKVRQPIADLRKAGFVNRGGKGRPPSVLQKEYSGHFNLRAGPRLHKALAIRAAQAGDGLNDYCVKKLAEAVKG